MLAIFVPFHVITYQFQVSLVSLLFFCAYIIPYSFEVFASRHLFEQNTFSQNHELQRFYIRSQGPSNLWRDHEEIKDLSEKCQREKEDCLTKEFVSGLPESSFLGSQPYDLKDLKGIWEKWSTERQAEFKRKYGEVALLLNVEIDWQLIKAIMPFWDPSYRCFTFNQEDMTPTIEEYSFMLRIEPRNR